MVETLQSTNGGPERLGSLPRATQLVKTRTRHKVLPPWGDEEKGMGPYLDEALQRVGPQRCTRGERRGIPPPCQPCLSWKPPSGKIPPSMDWRLPVFSDVASRGHQDHCTAAPGSGFRAWGPGAQGTDIHTHQDGVRLLWDTRWESYPGSCHVEGGAHGGTVERAKEISALPESGTSAPGVE